MIIASGNKGDVVSTNHLLLFPISNKQRVPVLCINTSSDLYRLSSSWPEEPQLFFLHDRAASLYFYHLQDLEHQTRETDFSLMIYLFQLMLFLCSSCVLH